ncbi:MAG: radical SAM protein [Synergistaceae bacterium]|jgi:histone acetyltransferase (RNA polymerase elongator complex component)|nr:radical SAM protein [Synergistaceae bacterium]
MKRVAFFIPFQGCGRRCVYCDQRAITGVRDGEAAVTPEAVKSVMRSCVAPVDLCFFGGSFAKTGPSLMESYLETVRYAPEGSRVTFSSYPGDFEGASGAYIIKTLKKYPIGTIELGLPSLDPLVLRMCGRDDDPGKIKQTMVTLRDAGFRLGAQIMIGLPGQAPESSMRDIESIASLMTGETGKTWDLRVYPCLVLRGTELESLFKAGQYVPLVLEDAVREAGALLLAADRLGFRAIRVGLLESASLRESVVAGPYHQSFGELALSEKLALEFAAKTARKEPWKIDPRKISQLTGHGGRGIKRLAELTGISAETVRKSLA